MNTNACARYITWFGSYHQKNEAAAVVITAIAATVAGREPC